jgi:hypothetical protein
MGGPACNQACKDPIRYNITDYHYVGGYYGGCSEGAMMEEIYNYGPSEPHLDAMCTHPIIFVRPPEIVS